MRPLSTVLAAVALLLPLGGQAAASCRPPLPLGESAAGAVAVVHGTVESAAGGALTLRVKRVLKGTAGPRLSVFVGPGRGGPGGTAVATSVDYGAAVGSEHVIYVIRGADGRLETNACVGSHEGPPTPEEAAFFGAAATTPDPAGPPPETVPTAELPWSPLLAGVAAIAIGVVLLAARRMRAA
ncbi:MAG TPA: hypothetical protein VFM93_06535 [Candidatus Limnocylindria bacterium]|nr:hypothetical protein [Candidatus Limnocylindria bacterium]